MTLVEKAEGKERKKEKKRKVFSKKIDVELQVRVRVVNKMFLSLLTAASARAAVDQRSTVRPFSFTMLFL